MSAQIIEQLKSSLARSDSAARKEWANQIADAQIPLVNLLPLLHGDLKTAQKFTWLIADLCDIDPQIVAPCMPTLFSLRHEMTFPGMNRGVAKWLWLTNVPQEIEAPAIEQLLIWLGDTTSCIGSKSYSAKALYEMAVQQRVALERVRQAVGSQTRHHNRSFAGRMKKLQSELDELG